MPYPRGLLHNNSVWLIDSDEISQGDFHTLAYDCNLSKWKECSFWELINERVQGKLHASLIAYVTAVLVVCVCVCVC